MKITITKSSTMFRATYVQRKGVEWYGWGATPEEARADLLVQLRKLNKK